MSKTLSHTKWFLNGDKPATGKEVVVEYSPETGVDSFQVFAVQKVPEGQPEIKIDITEAEVSLNNFEAEDFAHWRAKYFNGDDQYWEKAKEIAREHAKSLRH